MDLSREKVIVTQAVAAIMALLTLLVALDIVSLSGEQLAQTEEALAAVLTVLIPLAMQLWGRTQVTPVEFPEDDEGVVLQRVDGRPAVKR